MAMGVVVHLAAVDDVKGQLQQDAVLGVDEAEERAESGERARLPPAVVPDFAVAVPPDVLGGVRLERGPGRAWSQMAIAATGAARLHSSPPPPPFNFQLYNG
ncbi:hypothetical protein DIPPA_20455 [Diplonema papillatum]|nr:hypothetical protein DIPPA_20455 [Diplonema papillatum]